MSNTISMKGEIKKTDEYGEDKLISFDINQKFHSVESGVVVLTKSDIKDLGKANFIYVENQTYGEMLEVNLNGTIYPIGGIGCVCMFVTVDNCKLQAPNLSGKSLSAFYVVGRYYENI